MKKFLLAILALATALAITPAAMADSFNYTYSDGSGVTATGTLTTIPMGGGEYEITGGTITLAGGGIAGTGVVLPDTGGAGFVYTIQNPPNSGGANLTADNLLWPGGNPELDDNGFNFELTSTGILGDIWGEIWGNGPGNYAIYEGNYTIYDNGGSFNATNAATPEPSSLLLLGTGLLGLALVLFRKAKPSRSVLNLSL